MKASVFDAQIFNMVSLCWDNCVTNGKLMMERMNLPQENPEHLEFEDTTKFLMIIDESHGDMRTTFRTKAEFLELWTHWDLCWGWNDLTQ